MSRLIFTSHSSRRRKLHLNSISFPSSRRQTPQSPPELNQIICYYSSSRFTTSHSAQKYFTITIISFWFGLVDRHHDIWSPRILAPGVSIWTLILRSYYCWWRTRDSRWPRYDDGWVVVLTASSQHASSPIVSSELNCFNNKTSLKTIQFWPEAPFKSNIWNVFNAA